MRWDCEAVKTRVKTAKAVVSASSKVMRTDWRGERAICARASIGVALRLRIATHVPNCKMRGKKRRKIRILAINRKADSNKVSGDKSSKRSSASRAPVLVK